MEKRFQILCLPKIAKKKPEYFLTTICMEVEADKHAHILRLT